jgi:hypothetical protein
MQRFATMQAAIVGLAVAVGAGGARAAVMPYTQLTEDRNISVRNTVSGPNGSVVLTDSESSNAPGTFFRSMSFDQTGQSPGSGPPPRATVTADQGVVFGETSIFGSVGLNIGISGEPTAGGEGNTATNSTFRVDQPTPFSLDGRLRLSADVPRGQGQYFIGFSLTGTGPGGETEEFVQLNRGIPPSVGFGANLDEPLTASGTLLPGWTYRLATNISGFANVTRFFGQGEFIDGHVDFALTVPEPGAAVGLGMVAAGTLLRRRRTPVTAASA